MQPSHPTQNIAGGGLAAGKTLADTAAALGHVEEYARKALSTSGQCLLSADAGSKEDVREDAAQGVVPAAQAFMTRESGGNFARGRESGSRLPLAGQPLRDRTGSVVRDTEVGPAITLTLYYRPGNIQLCFVSLDACLSGRVWNVTLLDGRVSC